MRDQSFADAAAVRCPGPRGLFAGLAVACVLAACSAGQIGGGGKDDTGGAGGEGGEPTRTTPGTVGSTGGNSGGSTGGKGGAGGSTGGMGGEEPGTGGTTGGTGGRGTGGTGGTPAPADAGAVDAPAPVGESLHFVVYGDTRTNPSTHQKVVDAYAKLNPQLVIHSGDLWDEYSGGMSQWTGIINKNPSIAMLLQKNLFLVAQGNHESSSELLAHKPTLVRGNTVRYALAMGNAYFVILGMDPSSSAAVTFLQQQLATPEAKAATWRFAFSHYPTWNGGDHANDGYPALEKAADEGHLTMHIGGHDHNYQRSYLLYGQKPVDTSDTPPSAKGTVYMVAGGGGAPLYPVNKIPNLKTVKSINHFVEITADASAVDVKVWDLSGKSVDAFKIVK